MTSDRRSRLARGITLVLLFAAPVDGQTPARPDLAGDARLREIQLDVLAGKCDEARARIGAIAEAATPAQLLELRPELDLLAAAASAPLARPDAMRAVAEKWPQRREGAVALVAGLASWKALFERELDLFAPLLSTAPPREIAIDGEARSAFDAGDDARRAAFRLCVEQLEQRPDHDPELLQRARLLLADLTASSLEPLRLRTSQSLQVPRPLAEAIHLRVDRLPALDTNLREWFTSDHAAAPVVDRSLTTGRDDDALPLLAPGIYGVELHSPATGWSGVRELLVSDLDLLVDQRGDACLVLALLNGAPRPDVELALDDGGAGVVSPILGRTGADGTALLRLEKGRARLRGRCVDERGEHVAVAGSLDRREWESWRSPRDSVLVHVMADAPLHRRGETVRGRIIARAVVERPLATPSGLTDAQPVVRPLAHEALALRFWPGSHDERIVRGVTDADGVLPFELALDDASPFGAVVVGVELDRDSSRFVGWARPFAVEEIKRPPLLLDVAWPKPFARGAARPAVRVTARLPSGAPAGELAGTLELTLGSFTESHDFRLDALGDGLLPVACDTLPAAVFASVESIDLKLSITGPDGQLLEKSGSLKLVAPAPPKEAARTDENPGSLHFDVHSDSWRAGEPVDLVLAGPAGGAVLVAAGRAQIWWHAVVRLDASGRGRVAIPTQHEWLPSFEATAAMVRPRDGAVDREERTISLSPPGGAVRAELAEHDARFAPGTRTTLHVTTRDDDGHPLAAIVSVAIVDESLFLLAEDRTTVPSRDLLPTPDCNGSEVVCSAPAADPFAVVGKMLELGRVRAQQSPTMGGGGDTVPGNPGGAADPTAALRTDLRPIAAFIAKLKTDDDGHGCFTVDLPDDLTRWRVTLVVVTDDGRGEITGAAITTIRDPNVQIVAPRFLRSGDELTIPAVANAEADVGEAARRNVILCADASPEFALAGSGEAPELAEQLTPGASLTKLFRLRAAADRADHATFTVELRNENGVRLDGERRELPIFPRTILRPRAATSLLRGGESPPLRIEPATLADALSTRLSVELLGDRDALLASASRWLESYPYGCAEQTISRLVPIFAAARARRLSDRSAAAKARVDLTPQQARRFEYGMARLRDLATRDGYRWWPGGGVDVHMTPIVLTGLALAREAGLDPAAYRAVADLHAGAIGDCVIALQEAGGDPFVAQRAAARSLAFNRWSTIEERAQIVAETAVAVLRYDPADADARDAVGKLVRTDAPLSSNLLFRTGLALVRAGDRDGALRAMDRATGAKPNPPCVIPLENAPEALAANHLELARALDRPHAEIDAAEAELLGLFNDDRFGTTWSTAVALCALTGGDPPAAANAMVSDVVLRAGGREQTVHLDDTNRRHATLDLGDVRNVELTSAAPTHVVAVVTRRHEFDGVTSGGWREPLQVERRFFKCVANGKRNDDDVPADVASDGSLTCAVGDCLEVEVTVRGPADLTYFVVASPLPAGCELVGRGDGAELMGGAAEDARVVWAFSALDEHGERRARARIIAAHACAVGWPAAQAEAMYRPGTSGASRGARLVIEPARAHAPESQFIWLSPAARATQLDALVQRAYRKTDEFRDRSDALRELSRFPDDVASALASRLTPDVLHWSSEVERLLDLLGENRVALLDGHALTSLAARANPPTVLLFAESLAAWSAAFRACDEGGALVDRWRRAPAELGPIEQQIAAAATIFARRGSDDSIDVVETLRTLRVLDFQGDAEVIAFIRSARIWIASFAALDERLAEVCRSIVDHDGVRTRPRDPSAFAKLDGWQPLIEFVRDEIDGATPATEACRLADHLVGFTLPQLLGAAPFPEEEAVAASIASLRSSLARALVRMLKEDDLGRFDGAVPGRELLDEFDGAEAEAWLIACIDSADGESSRTSLKFVDERIEQYADHATLDSPLGRRLIEVADHGPKDWRSSALRAFPVEARGRLPLALLTKDPDDGDGSESAGARASWLLQPWRVDAFAESAAGRAAALAAIVAWDGGDAHAAPFSRVIVKCSNDELAALPFALLLELFPELEAEARACVRSEVVRRAVAGPPPFVAELAERLAEPQDERVRELLVEAVAAAAGAADDTQVIWDGDDPTADRWRTLLAARRGNEEELETLRGSIRAAHRGRDPEAWLPEDELKLLEETLLTHATLADVASGLFGDLDDAALRARFASLRDDELPSWLDQLERTCTGDDVEERLDRRRGIDPLRVLAIVPRDSLSAVWPRWLTAWQRASPRFDCDPDLDVPWFCTVLTGHFFDATGEPVERDPRPSDGDPRTLIRHRILWDQRLPDLGDEREPVPAELATAWHWELIERGLALR